MIYVNVEVLHRCRSFYKMVLVNFHIITIRWITVTRPHSSSARNEFSMCFLTVRPQYDYNKGVFVMIYVNVDVYTNIRGQFAHDYRNVANNTTTARVFL